MEPVQPNELRACLDLLLLTILGRGEAHGYDIIKKLDDEGRGLLAMKEGTLYPALYRLEESGLVASRWEEGEGARPGPRRRFYRLTGKGHKELESRRAQWRRFVTLVNGIVEPA